MTAAARQIELALHAAAPEQRFALAAQLIAMALADDDVLNPVPSNENDLPVQPRSVAR